MGKQTDQVFEFVTVALLECHLIVPIERGRVVLEYHGGRIMEAVRNSCSLILPTRALVFVDTSGLAIRSRLRFECLPLESEVAQTLKRLSHSVNHTGGYHCSDTGNREERTQA